MDQIQGIYKVPKFPQNMMAQRLPDIPPPPAMLEVTEKEGETVIEPPSMPEVPQNSRAFYPNLTRLLFTPQNQQAPLLEGRSDIDLIPKDVPGNSTEQFVDQSSLAANSKKINKDRNIHLTRKIVKNYGKAIASFSCCEKAYPILDKILNKNLKHREEFISFVYENKEFIEGNRRLMQLLIISDNESPEMQRNKKVFKQVAEIFMKKYVQQWLWNSKLVNKELHAQLLKEMRKRIRYPELLEHLSE